MNEYVWYDANFTQMKWSNPHEVTKSSSWYIIHLYSDMTDTEITASVTGT